MMPPPGEDTHALPERQPSTQDFLALSAAADSLPTQRQQPSTLSPDETSGTPAEIPRPKIPGYEILSELGRGGMGVVYQAKHLTLHRTVALKMILAGSAAGAEMLRRFRQEARIIAELEHTHIVQVYDSGEWEGKPYISLEHVAGPSLDRFQQGQPLPPRAAAELMAVLAETMGAVHRHGIIHRDLKPANILLKPKNTASSTNIADFIPKITDFGLAKKMEPEGDRTKTGAVLGSPNYMAPEQVEGRIRDIAPTTDVFALGAILYELLTGQPPFTGDSLFAIMAQIVDVDPVPPRERQPLIPEDMAYICLKCLRKRPSERYATATALAADLRRFLNGEPVAPRVPPVPKDSVKHSPYWSLYLLLAALAAGVVLLAVNIETVKDWLSPQGKLLGGPTEGDRRTAPPAQPPRQDDAEKGKSFDFYLRRAKSREATDPNGAIQDFEHARQHATKANLAKTKQCTEILAPALAFAESAGPTKFDEPVRATIAELYAAKGSMIYKEPFPAQGEWPLRRDDPYREAASAYEEALRFYPPREDATRALYHTQHGMCLAKLSKHQLSAVDIQGLEKDAAAATRMNPKAAEAFNLLGMALYYRATLDKTSRRTSASPADRSRQAQLQLEKSVNAYTKAFSLAPASLNKVDLSIWHTNRGQTYSFWAQVLAEDKKDAEARTKFEAAIKDAETAVALHGDNVNAYTTLGIAHQLLAMHLRTGPDAEEHWRKAEEAFKVQISQRQHRTLAHVNMGTFFVYSSISTGNNDLLARARGEFDIVLKLNATNPDAHFWLGFIAQREQEPDKAAEHFFQAVQDPKYMRYNVSRITENIQNDKSLEAILFSPAIDRLAPKSSELAPWMILRASFRLAQVNKRLADPKKLDLSDVATLEQCIAHADQAAKVVNISVKSMALEIGAEARLLAALVKEAPKEKRVEWVKEAQDRLKQLTKEQTPDLFQRWVAMGDVCFSLALEQGVFSPEQRRTSLDQAENAAREAESFTDDEGARETIAQVLLNWAITILKDDKTDLRREQPRCIGLAQKALSLTRQPHLKATALEHLGNARLRIVNDNGQSGQRRLGQIQPFIADRRKLVRDYPEYENWLSVANELLRWLEDYGDSIAQEPSEKKKYFTEAREIAIDIRKRLDAQSRRPMDEKIETLKRRIDGL